MHDTLTAAADTLDEIPERTKVKHLWKVYTGAAVAGMTAMFIIATWALKIAMVQTVRDEFTPALEGIRTNLASYVTADTYRVDQDTKERQRIEREQLRERVAELEKTQLSKRVETLETTAKENRKLIEDHYKEMSGSLHRIELGVANIVRKTGE